MPAVWTTPAWIFGIAALLYALFLAWYQGWRAPLTPAEVDAFLARIPASVASEPERLAALRAFLAADDGREFFMVNLVRLEPGPVVDPAGGAPVPAARVLEGYTRPFLRALLLRAGHPAFFGRAAGGYLEHWRVAPDPGWSFAGMIRYRSRRDLVELVVDERFAPAHAFKRAAIACTFAFPAAPGFVAGGPRVVVGLGLALVAALAQLGLRAVRG